MSRSTAARMAAPGVEPGRGGMIGIRWLDLLQLKLVARTTDGRWSRGPGSIQQQPAIDVRFCKHDDCPMAKFRIWASDSKSRERIIIGVPASVAKAVKSLLAARRGKR